MELNAVMTAMEYADYMAVSTDTIYRHITDIAHYRIGSSLRFIADSKGTVADLYMSVADFADYVRIAPDTLYKLISAGKIKCVKIGRQYRIRLNDMYYEPISK